MDSETRCFLQHVALQREISRRFSAPRLGSKHMGSVTAGYALNMKKRPARRSGEADVSMRRRISDVEMRLGLGFQFLKRDARRHLKKLEG